VTVKIAAEKRRVGSEKGRQMFLLRTAFWLAVVVILLPADPETGEEAPRVGAFEALSAAQTAVHDVSQFCVRNPDVCDTGGTAFHVFADKVRYGTRMLYSHFGDEDADEKAIPARETLTPDDVEPGWQAAKSDKPA
jgi:hypothetical protein